MQAPETHYVNSGDVYIAYQVVGEGSLDLVLVQGFFTHLDRQWEEPSFARFLQRLASFSRLIAFDPRGTGLSDRALELPTLEQQMEDVNLILHAIGSRRAAVFGVSQGGPMAALYAATYPERTSALILYATNPTIYRDDDYPWGRTVAWVGQYMEDLRRRWGTTAFLERMAPSMAADGSFREWWGRFERSASSPGNALAWARMHVQIDIRHVLPFIRVPTLVLHRREDPFRDPANGRYIAERIPGARHVELSGRDHLPYVGDQAALLDEIEEFLTGARPVREAGRVLATVLFTDIVGSTERASALGDQRWGALLDEFYAVVRGELERFRGREVDTAGDGFLATFDGPARAIRCAQAIIEAVSGLGLELRAGLHTGEIELSGERVRGIAVHIGARVAGLAGPGEVLVTRTVRDLVAGSGIEFEDRGTQPLKGVPEDWQIYAASF